MYSFFKIKHNLCLFIIIKIIKSLIKCLFGVGSCESEFLTLVEDRLRSSLELHGALLGVEISE